MPSNSAVLTRSPTSSDPSTRIKGSKHRAGARSARFGFLHTTDYAARRNLPGSSGNSGSSTGSSGCAPGILFSSSVSRRLLGLLDVGSSQLGIGQIKGNQSVQQSCVRHDLAPVESQVDCPVYSPTAPFSCLSR